MSSSSEHGVGASHFKLRFPTSSQVESGFIPLQESDHASRAYARLGSGIGLIHPHISWEKRSMKQERAPGSSLNVTGIESASPQEMPRLVERFDWYRRCLRAGILRRPCRASDNSLDKEVFAWQGAFAWHDASPLTPVVAFAPSPIWHVALYQGKNLLVPNAAQNEFGALAPCGLLCHVQPQIWALCGSLLLRVPRPPVE
jgi:hypothetical protein